VFLPRAELANLEGAAAGVWAYEALRIEAGAPRFGLDTDERAIPNELGWLGVGVHLNKGCYRGQETVARVHNLGRPPRRLVRLHLDGSVDRLPQHGDAVLAGEKQVGVIGSAARHHELGPIALAVVKRNVDPEVVLDVVAEDQPTVKASQEVLVDPEVGLHVRSRL
jgi:folate-binding protein YgfZ